MTSLEISTPQERVTPHSRYTFTNSFVLLIACILCFTVFAPLKAQTGGEAGIQGTVVDGTGAVIPGAVVTATNVATGVVTTRTASGDGLYTISPIIPGVYTVSAKAKGFKETTQKNLSVDALKFTGLNLTLAVGSEGEEVTVTGAPPALETTNAVLGAVMENETYANLPLQMGGQQRDPTAFAVLVPGVQGGTRAPIIGGTGNFLAAVYIDGIPVTTINQQGDNRVVSNALPVESIDQFQVITSTPDAEYQGAGIINFTLKSGASKYHGSAAAYVRARAFDTWSYAAKDATAVNAAGQTVQSPKPDEHQSEYVAAAGGPIPFMRKHGFFYVTYDKYHGRSGINPNFLTIPTALMRQGNFSELSVPIYDPTTDGTCATVGTSSVCRSKFVNNTIPMPEQSPMAIKMQSYLPTNYENTSTVNNFFGGVPSGFDNWEIAGRADFDLTAKQRLSYVMAYGVRKNVPFTVGTNAVPAVAGVVLPLPYTAGGYATITPVVTDIEHVWQISNSMTNQLKFAFNRFGQPITNLTDGLAPYRAAADIGITGLPAGQASTEFPEISFSTTTANPAQLATWTSNGASGATQTTIPNTFTLLDNFLITKGKHSLTIGFTTQWLEDNVASQLGPSGVYQLGFSANSTAAVVAGTVSPNAASNANSPGPSGFSYASYLLGAASQSNVGLQAVAETGGRYHDTSPYVADVWKIKPNLTLNIGLRWDYFPPFHEVEDRWSFMNPNIMNTITGTMGALQFAGSHGGAGVSCGCRTPVQTWMKNFGPRLGLAYSVSPTTVVRIGYGLVYSIGGGVGGRAGAGNGTGATGFNTSATTPTEITATSNGTPKPSYYLNNSAYFTSIGLANTQYGGPGYTLPALPQQNAAAQTLLTSFFGTTGSTGSGPGYADPYLSGRAPEFSLFNAGIQQALTQNLTLTLNYAGTQSHFLLTGGSNPRGFWANQLDPKYLVALGAVADSTGKGPLLGSKATPANVAIAQNALPGYKLPYAAISSTGAQATIAQTLVAFPQYNGLSDTWGQNVGNLSYNSLQASLAQRASHGISYTFNYTWSRNIGDDGTFRSGFDLPAGSVSGNNKSFHQNRIDRSVTITDMTHNISAYGLWELPFGKGHIGSDRFLVRALAGGWQISTIYQFTSGTPFVPSYGGCTAPNAGTCGLDLNPNYTGNGHIAKGYRHFKTQYIDPNAFSAPTTFSTALTTNYNKIGNAPRSAPYGLRNPYFWKDDVSLRRTFPIWNRLNFVAEVDCLNVANHATLSNPSAAWGAPGTSAGNAFGVITGAQANSRDFQFAGHINF
jgi:Carboxypeptidase regulatory-like domain